MSTSTDHDARPASAGEYDGPALSRESHGGHPSDLQYIYIALFLAAVTAVEVWMSYIDGIEKVRPYLLIGAAIVKFTFVAAYFMHLKFDHKNFRRLFLVGICMAMFCYLVVLFAFHALHFGGR